ncbi:MAG: hypothetical protein GX653_08325 [Clostridiales bacterium]|nr:hypothetical protein [Clostridiales bacterium]
MYKLLLVTDRDEVVEAFEHLTDLGDMMFAPVHIIRDAQQAIDYLERSAVDAVGYSFAYTDPGMLHQYLVEVRPSLPIFQPHHQQDDLRDELTRIRRFLDRMHADDSDEEYDEAAVLEYLRDELMHQLLAREIASPAELYSRLRLMRANLAQDRPAFLFDFDLPQGEVYLEGRWHYGRERLENALRSNFFGRYADNIYYGVAVLTPRHIRLIGCQRYDSPEEDVQEVSRRVQQHVQQKVADIKEYLDLDLDIEQFTVLRSLNDITGNGPD